MGTSEHNGKDDLADRALRDGLRASALSPDALQRIRHATHAEWQANTRAPARRRWLALAAAASVVTIAAVLGGSVFMREGALDSGTPVGELARADAPGIVEPHLLRADVALAPGSKLRVGHSFDMRGASLVTLAGGGNLRVARASAIEVLAAGTIRLERGELYVDIPPGTRGQDYFLVVTPAGEFRHVGTQFAVAIVNGETRLRVREGSVQWHATEGDSTVDAGTEVFIDGHRNVTRRTIATTGRDWAWVESLAPEIEIEDRPLQTFLEWVSRETGRKLMLTDESVRKQVESIRMHGNVQGLTAIEALSAVMSATTLSFELPEGMIRVSSAREPPMPTT